MVSYKFRLGLLLFDFSMEKNFSFLGWCLADGTLGDVALNVRSLDRCHHHRHRFCTHVRRIKEMTGLYGLTIGVIIIGIGSAHNKDQRDGWFIWTNDRGHHHRHRFCTQ